MNFGNLSNFPSKEIRFEYILEKTQMEVKNSFLNFNFSTFHPKTSLID